MNLGGPQVREQPYVWVTWLAKLLSGHDFCWWASWFRAQHEGWSWPKAPSDFDRDRWIMEHNTRLNEERERLIADGAAVYVDNQNNFKLRGASATLAGTPDLVSIEDGNVTIHDIKSGQPHVFHSAQVMLYMWAFPLARPQYRDLPMAGRVVYNDYAVDIPSSAVDEVFVDRVASLIKRLADGERPPLRTPSPSECGFCDITSANCPERIDEDPEEAETELF